MKRIVSVILLICLMLTVFAGCTKVPQKPAFEEAATKYANKPEKTTAAQKEEDVTVHLAAVNGPGAMGLVYLFDSIDKGNALGDYRYEITDKSSVTAALVAGGQYDIAAVNIADALHVYNESGGKVYVIALSSLSCYYFVELGEVSIKADMPSMSGKLYVDKGSLLEPVMDVILKHYGNTSLSISTQYEEADLADLAVKGRMIHGVISEPLASASCAESKNSHVGLDLADLWTEAVADTEYSASQICSTCIIANKDFVDSHPKATAVFLKEAKASVKNVNSQLTAPALVVQYELAADEEAAKSAIASCRLVCKVRDDIKTILGGFLTVLSENGATAVSELPDDGFYYMRNY